MSILFGLFFDRMMAYGIGAIISMQNALRQAVFLETVFILMVKLAKADEHVSQHEIDHAEKFMQKLVIAPGHRLQAKEIQPAHDLIKQH